MTRYLLDANLSPKVARLLARELQLDVVSLQGQRPGQRPDHEVIRMARPDRRVIVTPDRDFAEYYHRTARPDIGITYLDLPTSLRTIPEINRVLEAFFSRSAHDIDLEHSLVTITGHEVRILYG